MTVKPVTYYSIHCDFPGCGASPHDFGSEYGAWISPGQAADEAESSEWSVGSGGDFCPNHVIFDEDGQAQPMENTSESLAKSLLSSLNSRIDSRFRYASSRLYERTAPRSGWGGLR